MLRLPVTWTLFTSSISLTSGDPILTDTSRVSPYSCSPLSSFITTSIYIFCIHIHNFRKLRHLSKLRLSLWLYRSVLNSYITALVLIQSQENDTRLSKNEQDTKQGKWVQECIRLDASNSSNSSSAAIVSSARFTLLFFHPFYEKGKIIKRVKKGLGPKEEMGPTFDCQSCGENSYRFSGIRLHTTRRQNQPLSDEW